MHSSSQSPTVITGIGLVAPHATVAADLCNPAFRDNKADDPTRSSWFYPEQHFGMKGFKYQTPAAWYVLAGAKLALDDAGLQDNHYAPEEKGVLIGTNFGAHTVLAEMDRVASAEGADSISPMAAPNFSVNIPASQISIKHGFRAFNICLTSAVVSGLEAVMFADNAIQRGRARLVMAGATEDRPPVRTGKSMGADVAEGGACVFILETLENARARGAKIYSQIGQGILRFTSLGDLQKSNTRDLVKTMIRQGLDRIIQQHQKVVHYCPLTSATELNIFLNACILQTLEERGIDVRSHSIYGSGGDFMSVSPLFQAGAVSAIVGEGLIMASSPQGHIALLAFNRVM